MHFTIVIYSSTKCPTFTAENISPIILSFFLPLCIKITFRQIESNLLMRLTDLHQCQPSCHGVFTLLFHSHTMTAALVTLGSGVCTRLSATCGQIIVFISLMRNWYTCGYLSGWTYWWRVSDNRPGSANELSLYLFSSLFSFMVKGREETGLLSSHRSGPHSQGQQPTNPPPPL